jgi:TRAP-type C4-dicarboxylate transport system substrate-binding protein
MKKIGIAVALIMIFAGNVMAEPIVLKYANFEPPQSWAMKTVWGPWVAKMEKEGGGAFKIDVFAGGTLNRNPVKQLKIMRDGVADISFIIPSYTPGTFIDDSVLEVPFVADKAIDAALAIFRMWQKGMLRNYDQFVPLMISAAQQYGVHSTFPVKTPKDLNGKKLRSTGKMQHFFAKAYGAAPVGMPVTKIAESMSRGLLHATTNEWNAVRTFKIGDVTKYHCMVPLGTVSFLLAMNKQSFNKLPKKAQDVFIRNQEYTSRLWADELDKSLDVYYENIKKDPNHHVYIPNSSELAEWKRVLEPAVQEWMNVDPGRKYLLQTYKEEVAKVRR